MGKTSSVCPRLLFEVVRLAIRPTIYLALSLRLVNRLPSQSGSSPLPLRYPRPTCQRTAGTLAPEPAPLTSLPLSSLCTDSSKVHIQIG